MAKALSAYASVRFPQSILIAIAILWGMSSVVRAGGGPQNLLLVVNPRSWASLTVANHYIAQRKIPANNVLFLDWPGSPLEATSEEFRKQILEPVLAAIQNRGLAGQIDYVAYSSDFPYRIDAQADLGGARAPLGFGPFGTLTSFTYLWQLVRQKQASPMMLEANHYFSRQSDPTGAPPSRAFHLTTGWDAQGKPVTSGGQNYLLSTMLAMTSGRGTSVSEAIAYLAASAKSDGTLPKGTIYFTKTADVRTQTRQALFAPAIVALQELNVKAEIVTTPLPLRKDDVQGLTLGADTFDWPKSGSKILPGAICENLTSTGGFLYDTGNQTPMTEFLRAGAAGTSGTTIEPGAIPQKFPSPFIHVHYARGGTLAEAFYQSVHGPYQLLIIGDALCQPWATGPTVTIEGVAAGQMVSGTISLKPGTTNQGPVATREFQILVDGRRVGICQPGESFELDTTTLTNGYHEVAAVAIANSSVEQQSRASLPIAVKNSDALVTLTAEQSQVAYGQPLKLTVATVGTAATQVTIFQASRAIARAEGNTAAVDSRVLGFGEVRLQAIATDSAGKALASSPPLEVTVGTTTALPAIVVPRGRQLLPGLELTLASGRRVAVKDTSAYDWLEKSGVGANEKYKLSGYFEAPKKDIYQFILNYMGELTLSVDGRVIYRGSGPDGNNPWHYVPVTLAPGSHLLEISGATKSYRRLQLRFGGPGAWLVGERQFRHAG